MQKVCILARVSTQIQDYERQVNELTTISINFKSIFHSIILYSTAQFTVGSYSFNNYLHILCFVAVETRNRCQDNG